MAVVSAATAVEPPHQLRDRLLTEVSSDPVRVLRPRIKRWQTTVLAAAAALVIGLGALGVGLALRPAPTPSTAEQVFAAPDVRTVSGEIPTGGTATVVFSREKNAGVLVMNNVAPPQPGTVYQMWLIDDKGPHSAGTMDAKNVAPSTTAVLPDLGDSQTLAFTSNPGGSAGPPARPSPGTRWPNSVAAAVRDDVFHVAPSIPARWRILPCPHGRCASSSASTMARDMKRRGQA
jgi:hypothetical protein